VIQQGWRPRISFFSSSVVVCCVSGSPHQDSEGRLFFCFYFFFCSPSFRHCHVLPTVFAVQALGSACFPALPRLALPRPFRSIGLAAVTLFLFSAAATFKAFPPPPLPPPLLPVECFALVYTPTPPRPPFSFFCPLAPAVSSTLLTFLPWCVDPSFPEFPFGPPFSWFFWTCPAPFRICFISLTLFP